MGRRIWLHRMLSSGLAKQLVGDAGLSTTAVAEIIGCSQPNAWRILAGKHFPRRATATRLMTLLEQLEVASNAS